MTAKSPPPPQRLEWRTPRLRAVAASQAQIGDKTGFGADLDSQAS